MAVHDHSVPRDGSSSFRLSIRKRTNRLRQKTSRSSISIPFTPTPRCPAEPHLPRQGISFRSFRSSSTVLHTPPPPYAALDPQDRLVVAHPSPASFPHILSAWFREELQHASNGSPLERRCISQPQYSEALQTTPHEVTQAASSRLDLSGPSQTVQLRRRNTTPTQRRERLPPSPNSISQTPRSRPYVSQCASCRKRRNDYEFPAFLPTRNCRHANATCSYCLHEVVEQAVAEGTWGSARCPECHEKLSVADMHQFVLRWMWRYTNSA